MGSRPGVRREIGLELWRGRRPPPGVLCLRLVAAVTDSIQLPKLGVLTGTVGKIM